MSLTLQRKDELIQQHHHAYSEWNVDLYGLIASIEAESVKEINDNQEYMKSQQTVISELQTERDALAEVVERIIDSASVDGKIGVEVVRTMIKEIGAQL